MGILILIQHFNIEFRKIKIIQQEHKYSLTYCEEIVLGCTHADIGAWLAEKWNLPTQLVDAIKYHHTPYFTAIKLQEEEKSNSKLNRFLEEDLLGSNSSKSKYALNSNNNNNENDKVAKTSSYKLNNQSSNQNKKVPITKSSTKLLSKAKKTTEIKSNVDNFLNFNEIKQPLTAIVSMSEWFAENLGYKTWSGEINQSKLFLASDIFEELTQNDLLDAGSAIGKLKQEILIEFEHSSELNKITTHSLY